MEIPSSQSPRIQGRDRTTKPVTKIFSEQAPSGSIAETLQDVYYSKPSESRLLSEVTQEKQGEYKEVLADAVNQGLLTQQEAETRLHKFESGAIGPYTAKIKTPPGAHALDLLNEMDDDQFALIRHPQQCGDGLYRPMDFYVSPGHLTLKAVAQGWETAKDSQGQDVPVADVVVVGAGPGGLMTSWQLARRGGRVVCFESELAGSNFNDGGAKAVHHMRTSTDLTNLVVEGHALATLEHPLSLSGSIGVVRPHAAEGREAQTALTGEVMHGIPEESTHQDRNAPATRGELWEHLSSLAQSLATDFPDAVLCERSPVSEVTYDDGLFTVSTARGHKIKCKELVLSTGLTGSKGERARSLPVLENFANSSPETNVVLMQMGSTQSEVKSLDQVAKGSKKATLIVNDRLLGDQAFRQTYAALTGESRAAIVGSGESAIKGALELLHLNPEMKVDLFVKGYLESAQVQVPSENFHPAVIEKTLDDPGRTKQLADMYKVFDTPVTPRSLQEILELQQAGRVRVLELGSHFDETSVALTAQSDGSTRIDIKDPNVALTLAKSEADYLAKGLLPQEERGAFTKGDSYSVIVQAAGYVKLKLKDHPLAQLPMEAQSKIHANTISNSLHPAQSALPGLGTAGRHLAEELANKVVPKERRVEITVPQDRGIDWRKTDLKTVEGLMKNGGLHPNFVDSIREEIAETGSSSGESYLTFPSVDTRFRDLAGRESALTPAEQEVLERGRHLQDRLKEAIPNIYKPL